MELKGTISQLKARVDAMGNAIQTVTLDVHGDFAALHAMLKKPLIIRIEDMK